MLNGKTDTLVLGNGISWAPYVACPPENASGHWFKVEDELMLQYGQIRVPHYDIKQKLAPPSIEVIVEYGKLVVSKLAKFGEVVHYGDFSRGKTVTDCTGFGAILVGYYLLLQGVSLQNVLSKLYRFVPISFPCMWCDATSKQSCRVGDCLLGLSVAMQRKWLLDTSAFETSMSVDLVEKFDAAWIIPGKLLVMADPMASLLDPAMSGAITLHAKPAPNPAAELQKINAGPSKLLERRHSKGLRVTIPPNNHLTTSQEPNSPLSPTRSKKGEYVTKNPYLSCPSTTPYDFSSFFQHSRIELLVRCNFGGEDGLAVGGGSYDQAEFDSVCSLLDIPFPDYDGGLPTQALVRQFLDAERSVRGCVAIHCKSGFGRSVTLAAVYLMCRYHFSGAAALGWLRLCRRGAITTPLQEEYIRWICQKNATNYFYGSPCCTIC